MAGPCAQATTQAACEVKMVEVAGGMSMSCTWGGASSAQLRAPKAAGTSGQCIPRSSGSFTVNGEAMDIAAAMAGPCAQATTQAACEVKMVEVAGGMSMSCTWGGASLAQLRAPKSAGTSGQCIPRSSGSFTVNGEAMDIAAAMAGPCAQATTQAACEGKMVEVAGGMSMSCTWGGASLAQLRAPKAAGASGQCIPGSS